MSRASARAALAAVALAWMAAAPATDGAASAQTAAAREAADLARLRELSDAWDQAIVARNRAAIAGNMAEDFRNIDGQANIGDKRRFLEDILDPKLTIDPYTVEDFEVRLFGDVALLSGRTRMTGRYDGKAFESNYRYIDVYARRDGEWRIVSVQITRIPAPEPPSPE